MTPLVQSPFTERNGVVSPDGRWLAYEANDSGRFEISVRPFPEVNSGHWQVSTAGGTRPLWARERAGAVLCLADGRAHAGGRGARPVVGGHDADAAGQGRLLHESGCSGRGRTYDISPDGQRFLMIKEGGGTDQTAAPPQPHRRAALGRGAEAPRADELTSPSRKHRFEARRRRDTEPADLDDKAKPTRRVFGTASQREEGRRPPAAGPIDRMPAGLVDQKSRSVD